MAVVTIVLLAELWITVLTVTGSNPVDSLAFFLFLATHNLAINLVPFWGGWTAYNLWQIGQKTNFYNGDVKSAVTLLYCRNINLNDVSANFPCSILNLGVLPDWNRLRQGLDPPGPGAEDVVALPARPTQRLDVAQAAVQAIRLPQMRGREGTGSKPLIGPNWSLLT